MSGDDTMTIEFLPDGRVKVTTDEISPANHMSAEDFLTFLGQKMGGTVDRTRRAIPVARVRSETHNHVHSHE